MAPQAPQRRGPPPTGHTSQSQQQAQRSRQHQNRQRVAQVPPARQSRGPTQTAPRQVSSGPSNRVPPNMSEPPLLASQAALQSLPSPPLLSSGSVTRPVIFFFELNKINFRFQIFPIFRSHHPHIHLQIPRMLFKRLLRHQLILH